MYMYAPQSRGLAGTADQIVGAGATTATAFGSQIAGSTGLTAAVGGSLAVPIVGLAIAGITIAITAWLHRRGPQQKIQTTHIVNEAEPYLKQNVDAYLNGPRTRANQAAATENFSTIWNAVVAECGQPQYGDPGGRCVTDRQRGSTKGYDWFALYLDPIANDTTVVADQPSSFTLFADAGAPNGGGISPMLLIGAGLLVAALTLK